MAPRENENKAYAKFGGDKQRTLWYAMVFSGVVNWVFRYRQSELQSQATNRETQKHKKQIEIHQSQIANHDLLNPLK